MQQQLMRMPNPPDMFKRDKEASSPQHEAEKVERRQAEPVMTPQQPRPDEQAAGD